MPNAYVLNQKPTSYGQALSLLTEMLFNAGWTYQGSGDGISSFSNTSKVLNNFVPGAANSWNNSNAWVRMRDPSGVREFVFQNPGALGSIRIKYSCSAKFAGTFYGAVSATTAPSATDEQNIAGGLSGGYAPNSSPPAAWFATGTTVGSVMYQGAAMGSAPYGFWFAAAESPRGQIRTGILYDPVISVPEDPDPYVITIGGGSCFLSTANFYNKDGTASTSWIQNGNQNTNFEGSFGFMDVGKTQFLNVQAASYGFGSASALVMDVGIPDNPFNGKPEALPIAYMRLQYQSASSTRCPGVKGWSTMARWTGHPRATFCDTYNNKSAIAVGAIWLPWDGVTTPLI